MLSIKDFAKENGVSYEAVRKQIKRYAAELEGHIHQQGRTQYLDDEACAFLREHRNQQPLVIYEAEYDKRLRELEKENKRLLEELAEARKDTIAAKDELLEAKGAQARLEGTQALLEASESRAEALQAENEALRAENGALQAENEGFERWIFGLWRKKR